MEMDEKDNNNEINIFEAFYNNKLKTFSEVIDNKCDGINCPLCHDKLQKKVWFANEIEEEKEEKSFMKQK